jgi:hypothetical protein
VNGSPPDATVHADGRYEQSLDPGTYLVCNRPDCASIQVESGHVASLHVKTLFGPTQFIVFDQHQGAQRVADKLEVGF